MVFESNGEMIVPFYTSAKKLEGALEKHLVGRVRLQARDFFRMASKARSVLNAGDDEQWTFCPADVAALLAPPGVDTAVLRSDGVGAPSAVSGRRARDGAGGS